MSQRIVGQCGLFSMTSDAGSSINRCLSSHPQLVRRIRIAASAKRVIRQRLDGLFGITERALWPGVDGVAHFIARWYSGAAASDGESDSAAASNAHAEATHAEATHAKATHAKATTAASPKTRLDVEQPQWRPSARPKPLSSTLQHGRPKGRPTAVTFDPVFGRIKFADRIASIAHAAAKTPDREPYVLLAAQCPYNT